MFHHHITLINRNSLFSDDVISLFSHTSSSFPETNLQSFTQFLIYQRTNPNRIQLHPSPILLEIQLLSIRSEMKLRHTNKKISLIRKQLVIQSMHQQSPIKIYYLRQMKPEVDNPDPQEQQEDEFYPNYKSEHCWFNRFFLFTHIFSSVKDTRQKLLKQIQNGEEQCLEIQDTHKIPREDSCDQLSKALVRNIQQHISAGNQLTASSMFKITLWTFKLPIFWVWLFYLLEAAFRIASSVVIQYLLESAIENDRTRAYWLAAILIVLILFSAVFRHNAFYQSAILNNRIKNSFIYTIYDKVSGLSQFMIRNADMGKVINMLASDFNTMEIKMTFVFMAMILPFVMIGVGVILVVRLRWIGLLCVAIPLVILPIQSLLGRRNGQILREVNQFKDKRVKTTTEVIEGIRFVKLYAWEIAFNKMIGFLRQNEIVNYVKVYFFQSLERAISNTSSNWAVLLTFVAIYFVNGENYLNAARIFATTELMGYFKMLVFLGAGGISFMFELKVIFGRFSDIYLIKNLNMQRINESTKQPEQQNETENERLRKQIRQRKESKEIANQSQEALVMQDMNMGNELLKFGEIEMVNFNGYWSTDDFTTPAIKNINLKIQKGKFYGIAGKVGSGKSGLLSCFLKEPPYYSGELSIKGSIAYVEQQPYIFAGTVRQNITFGQPFIQQKYDQVIRNACLESDFKIFPKGDLTIVGERGITVSGGQKARISFARAIYSDADIYLLDDPISAVDAKVARKLYENVIVGMLKKKTVVLVTHQVHYLTHCDRLIIMNEGNVEKFGTPAELEQDLAKFMILEGGANDKKGEKTSMKMMLEQTALKKDEVPESDGKPLENSKEESVEVSIMSYVKYILYNRKFFLLAFTLSLFLIAQGINTAFFRILAKYDLMVAGVYLPQKMYWMTLGLLQFGYWLVLASKYFCINYVCLKSNESLHNDMLISLLRSPTGYFDTIPTGRLINRFSNDLSLMDTTLAFTLIDTVQGPILSIILLINVFEIIPIFTAPGVVNVALLIIWLLYCKRSIIQSKLLDLKMKSPVFNNITAVTNGIVQIRIYNMRRQMNIKMEKAVNDSMRANNSFWFSSRIFGAYISYVSMIISAAGIYIGISTASNPGIYGVAIVFILQLVDFIQWLLRQIINMESIMVSVERSFLIAHLPDQGPLRTQYDQTIGFKDEIDAENKHQAVVPKTNWPQEAKIQLKDFTMRYNKNFNPVLKNLSFVINDGEKVGIVGRTGAGKSSVIQAIFRMVKGDEGSKMSIGNSDALEMGLHSLRKNLSIIPQTPFLFKGTIKENIDPFNEVNEQRIWEVLQQSDLRAYVETLPNGLDTQISNTSEVFSVGQKQLICLARAILRSSKILVLDEATSNVDMRTDDYIQRTLKTNFANQTIITIAHRLNTIADYDKVIVMDKGEIVEMGAPFELLANSASDRGVTKSGVFAEMVLSTGDNADNIFNLAKTKYLSKVRTPGL